VSEIRNDDRAWVEAVDRYVAGVRRERPRGSANGRYVLLSALVLAVTMSPVAIGATGSVLREGKRKDGTAINEAMPWKAYGQMGDAELKAIYAYLRTVPPLAKGNR